MATTRKTMPCPDDATLMALAHGRLSEIFARSLRSHLEDCASCLAATAEAARQQRDGAALPPSAYRPPELKPGDTIAERFRLESVLGSGGVGVVWSARRLQDDVPVAVKVLRCDGDGLSRRLRREARLARAVEHPDVVHIHEIVECPRGRPALVMDLLHGEDLAQRMRRTQRFSVPEVAALMLPALQALEALHRRAIAHRDLKPSNIFLSRSAGVERARLLDLGMARALDLECATAGRSRLTPPGTLLGTPRYMAPEQLAGADDVDVRADVWALGATLFGMLSGRPHLASSRYPEVVRELDEAAIPKLADVCTDIPTGLAQLVDQALSRSRDERPPVEALRDALFAS